MTDKIIRIRLDANQANRDINQLDGNMRRAGGAADGLQTAITRVAAAVAAAFSTRQIVAYADAFTNIQNKLRVVTGSTEELTQVTAKLLQVANDTRSSFDATADLFSKLTRSTEELGISQERLVAITTTINKSFAVAGASAQEASNAIRQLGQGLSAGALRGDEFNSVAEQAPGILRAVAAETGKTIGELRDFAAQGGITAELLIRSVENYADTVEKEYAKTNRTFEQSAVVARNNAVAYVGASELIADATSAAGNSLVFLSENLESVGKTFILIASVIGGQYLASIVAATGATITKTQATLNATIAERAQAQAAFFAANGIRVKTTETVRATAAQTAYAVALRASNAALGFLGGPAGLILLAASAFLLFSNNAATAREETEKLNAEIDKNVKNFQDLNREGKALTFQKLADQQLDLLSRLSDANVKVEEAVAKSNQAAAASGGRLTAATSSASAAVAQARRNAEGLKKELDELVKLQEALFAVGAPDEAKFIDPAVEVKAVRDFATLSFEELKKLDSDINSLFSGGLNLFGGEKKDTSQGDEQQARINARIQGLRLETQAIASETELRRAVREGELSQELADLDFQTQQKVDKATVERDLILAEQGVTDEQRLAAHEAYRMQLAAIDARYEEQKVLTEEQILARQAQYEQQLFDIRANSATSALNAISSFASQGSKIQKALFITTKGIQAAQAWTSGLTAAMLTRATIPYPFAEPIALAQIAQGKISAAAILATGIAGGFGGGGGSIGGGGGGRSTPAPQPQPTTPTSAPLVGNLEIQGLSQLTDELRNYDGLLPASFVARILEQIPAANRLRGEDI